MPQRTEHHGIRREGEKVIARASTNGSTCGLISDQVDLLKTTIDGGVPSCADRMWGAKPVGKDQHECQQESVHERDPNAFHGVAFSWLIVVGSCVNWMPNSEARAHVTRPCASLTPAAPGR